MAKTIAYRIRTAVDSTALQTHFGNFPITDKSMKLPGDWGLIKDRNIGLLTVSGIGSKEEPVIISHNVSVPASAPSGGTLVRSVVAQHIPGTNLFQLLLSLEKPSNMKITIPSPEVGATA